MNTTWYEPDDGPLTDEQIATIRQQSSATQTPEEHFNYGQFEILKSTLKG